MKMFGNYKHCLYRITDGMTARLKTLKRNKVFYERFKRLVISTSLCNKKINWKTRKKTQNRRKMKQNNENVNDNNKIPRDIKLYRYIDTAITKTWFLGLPSIENDNIIGTATPYVFIHESYTRDWRTTHPDVRTF